MQVQRGWTAKSNMDCSEKIILPLSKLVFMTLGVAKIVDISIAVDICSLKTAQS